MWMRRRDYIGLCRLFLLLLLLLLNGVEFTFASCLYWTIQLDGFLWRNNRFERLCSHSFHSKSYQWFWVWDERIWVSSMRHIFTKTMTIFVLHTHIHSDDHICEPYTRAAKTQYKQYTKNIIRNKRTKRRKKNTREMNEAIAMKRTRTLSYTQPHTYEPHLHPFVRMAYNQSDSNTTLLVR